MTTTEPMAAQNTRTITLTDAPPVRIRELHWPRIARADWYDNVHHAQANRECHLYVRRHADGRHLVYGVRTSQWEGERDVRGGEVLDADRAHDLINAIHRVADTVEAPEHLIAEVIADLPPIEI